MTMKFLKYFLPAVLLALSATTTSSANPEIVELDRIVAVVNRDVITASDLDKRVRQIKQRLQESNTRLPAEDVLRRQILDNMILEEIQLQLAQQGNIRVDDEQLNQVVNNIARQNNMQLEEFRTTLERQGISFAAFREDIRRDMIIGQLQRNQVENQINVSDQEIDTQLSNTEDRLRLDDEYHLAHILIAVPESARPEQIEAARQKAETTLNQLRFGADFAQTAISVSNDQRALQGGDLGWIKRGSLPTIFADIIPKLNIGELTPVVRSPSGFHIIKLIDKRSDTRKHMIQQTLARHILVRTSEIVTDTEARTRLARIRERIVNGEDFGTLAKSSSDDPGSAADGGNLGWVEPGKMVPEFEEMMNKLAPGEISEPFDSRFGWHIVQVLSRRQHDDTESYLRNQTRNLIHKRKLEVERQNWLRRIRDEAYVENRLAE